MTGGCAIHVKRPVRGTRCTGDPLRAILVMVGAAFGCGSSTGGGPGLDAGADSRMAAETSGEAMSSEGGCVASGLPCPTTTAEYCCNGCHGEVGMATTCN
jgi:hypothetical protein